MIDSDARDLVISVQVDDAAMAERIAHLLANVGGVRLVNGNEAADLAIVRQQAPESDPNLTPRERDALGLLAEGASNKAIARQLGISVHTAKFHVGPPLAQFDAQGDPRSPRHAD